MVGPSPRERPWLRPRGTKGRQQVNHIRQVQLRLQHQPERSGVGRPIFQYMLTVNHLSHIHSIRCVYIDNLVRWINSRSHEPDLVHAPRVRCLLARGRQPHSCPTPSIMLLARQRSKLVTRLVTARYVKWIIVRLLSCLFSTRYHLVTAIVGECQCIEELTDLKPSWNWASPAACVLHAHLLPYRDIPGPSIVLEDEASFGVDAHPVLSSPCAA